jgi:hypothetical protein
MTRFLHPLLLLIARFTDKQLAQLVEYLRSGVRLLSQDCTDNVASSRNLHRIALFEQNAPTSQEWYFCETTFCDRASKAIFYYESSS